MRTKMIAVAVMAFLAGLAVAMGGGWKLARAESPAGDKVSAVTTGPFKNYAPVVIQALQNHGLSGDCPMCKKNQWVVHEVPVSMPVYEMDGKVKFPGTSMPVAAMICKNCGFMSLHSLGALKLLNPNGEVGAATRP